jgi:hypothetical protein
VCNATSSSNKQNRNVYKIKSIKWFFYLLIKGHALKMIGKNLLNLLHFDLTNNSGIFKVREPDPVSFYSA